LDGFFLRDAEDFERWTAGHRRRLHEMNVATLERLARAADEKGDSETALSWWRRLVALEPTSTSAVSGLIRGLASIGDRAGALRQYREHEMLVRQEFGVVPDAALSGLAASLLPERVVARSAPHATNSGRDRNAPRVDRSLAVMPLKNLSGDK